MIPPITADPRVRTVEEVVDGWLQEKHSSTWGQGFSITKPDERERAVSWFVKQLAELDQYRRRLAREDRLKAEVQARQEEAELAERVRAHQAEARARMQQNEEFWDEDRFWQGDYDGTPDYDTGGW